MIPNLWWRNGIADNSIDRLGSAGEEWSLPKRPHALNRLAHHPALVVIVQELHLIPDYRDRLRVPAVSLDQRPIRARHQALGTERVVEPLHLRLRIEVGVGLLRKRPGMGDLHE